MAIHSSILAWRIPGTREPGGLPSMGSHRVGNDWSGLAAAAAAAAAAVLYCINTSAFVYPFTWLCMHVVLHCFSHVWLFVTPIDCSPLAPLSVEFARQEYWSGLPCPSPGDLPDLGTEPNSLMSPALAGGFFTTSATRKPVDHIYLGYLCFRPLEIRLLWTWTLVLKMYMEICFNFFWINTY